LNKSIYLLLLFSFALCSSKKATLTIYKDGTALVKQPVEWSIKSGYNSVMWGDLPDGIHKDTPFLNIIGADIISQTFNDNIFTSSRYFNSLRGKEIVLKPMDSKKIKGILLETSPTTITISKQAEILSYNKRHLEFYGKESDNLKEPIFRPYLSWDIKSKLKRVVNGELVYKTNNFSWDTVYRLKMINEEKGELIAEAVISNSSDMGFKNASLMLVEGNLNKVKSIGPRPERLNRNTMLAASEMMPNMSRDELGDYHIYALNESYDLGPKENITVRMYGPLDVGYEKKYVFENSERRQKEEPLEVQLTMMNIESNGLGISLPGGKVEIYSSKKSSGLSYIGADKMGQVPKGQSTTLTSGRAFDVIGNRKVLNYDRQRKSEEAVIEIKITNARSEEINVLLVEHINGDWIIKDESINYQKEDASTVHFPLTLNAGETKNVYYTYRKEWK
tara:strand:+ start:105 stop:1448 length:1344 start_codon:yes stop_codon:yes gene_type:complete